MLGLPTLSYSLKRQRRKREKKKRKRKNRKRKEKENKMVSGETIDKEIVHLNDRSRV